MSDDKSKRMCKLIMEKQFLPVFIILVLLLVGFGKFAIAAEKSSVTSGTESRKSYAGMMISSETDGGNRFVTSKVCGTCHEVEYKGWQKTFHSTVIRDAKANPSAILADFSAEELPFTREEVEYTIGSHWDQRYMKRIGDEYYVLPRLWSVQSKEWRPYSVWSWKRKPYSRYCAGCHTTNYNPANKTIAEEGIGCESCHGPGGKHAESEGDPELIVNPVKLPKDRGNMICASCHVRGTDKSGEYYFALGYLPGEDLSEYYTPMEINPDEEPGPALARLYGEWRDNMLNSSRAKCEVCGIAGQNPTEEKKDSAMEFCFSCHNFRTKMQLHTHHPDTVDLACPDCHVKQADDLSKGLQGDIHSYSYFLVHTENCYDPDIPKACAACHASEKNPREWAQDIINSWKKPVIINH